MHGSELVLVSTILLISLGSAQPCLVENCLSCLTPYTCLQCPPGLSCCQAECRNCTSLNQCSSCIQGYQLNSTSGLCQLINSCRQIACIKCSGTSCTQCMDGHVLDHYLNSCKKCPAQCEICNLFGYCQVCAPLYFANQYGVCERCLGYRCVRCDDAYTCKMCNYGGTLSVSQQQCVSCPSNCAYCVTVLACEVCISNFFLNRLNRCSPCSSSCQTCFGSAKNCTTCHMDSFATNGTCQPCYVAIGFCVSCIGTYPQVQCLNCTSKMFVEDNVCVPCPQGCLVCINMTACTDCEFGYFVTKSQLVCIPCNIENCLNCANTSYCQGCATRYATSSDGTYCVPCQPNCLICTQGNPSVCTQCLPTYGIINGECITCKPNCYDCQNNNLECGECYLNFYGVSHCLPCPIYCPECMNSAFCEKCGPGMDQYQGGCVPISTPNCFQVLNPEYLEPNPLCAICNPGYYLSNTQCLPCLSNCLICQNSSTCLACSPGFFVTNSQCLSCPTNCLTCASSYDCIRCAVGFYSNPGYALCIKCPVNCRNCTTSNSCDACSSGYYLSTSPTSTFSTCLKCVWPCLMCTSATQCNFCEGGYRLNKTGTCLVCPPGCTICDSRGSCQLCAEGYSLQLFQLSDLTFICSPCPQFCVRCSTAVNIHNRQTSVKCVECTFGMTLLSNNQCFVCGGTTDTAGCQKCNQSGQCISCFAGFQLSHNKCIFSNNQSEEVENWGLVGASITLGCLSMILLIAVLYLKLKKPSIRSGLGSQLN